MTVAGISPFFKRLQRAAFSFRASFGISVWPNVFALSSFFLFCILQASLVVLRGPPAVCRSLAAFLCGSHYSRLASPPPPCRSSLRQYPFQPPASACSNSQSWCSSGNGYLHPALQQQPQRLLPFWRPTRQQGCGAPLTLLGRCRSC